MLKLSLIICAMFLSAIICSTLPSYPVSPLPVCNSHLLLFSAKARAKVK